MTAPLIEADGIGKNYGSVIALRDVSTVVNAGEVTCVLGDNGAGKSTLIKVLAGVHQHDRGQLDRRKEPEQERCREGDRDDDQQVVESGHRRCDGVGCISG